MLMKKIENNEIDAYDESSKLKKRFVFDSKSKKIKTEKKEIKKKTSTKFKIKLKKKKSKSSMKKEKTHEICRTHSFFHYINN